MDKLIEAYDTNIDTETDPILPPIGFAVKKAQIEVVLDKNGDFLSAKAFEKTDNKIAETLLPMTEDSASRSGTAIFPHPLFDLFPFVAGDYSDYISDKKNKQVAESKFAEYMDQLENWCDSEYKVESVMVLKKYLSQKRLTEDLVKSGLFDLDENQYLVDKKINSNPIDKCLVRFQVMLDEKDSRIWLDKKLIDNYPKYYCNKIKKKNVCFCTGKVEAIEEKHAKNLSTKDANAKVISSNDPDGLTFRSRFLEKDQVFSIGYISAQKLHNALYWLIRKQGVSLDDHCIYLCFNPKRKKTENPLTALFYKSSELTVTDEQLKAKLSSMFYGKEDSFDDLEDVVVMGLDCAIPGRLAITYYNALSANDFFENYSYWVKSCRWKVYQSENWVPTFKMIVECAYGIESAKNDFEINEKLLKNEMEKLLKCMLYRQSIPQYLMKALADKASNPLAYKKNRNKVLCTACAVIKKYYYDKGVKYMTLDKENKDRSYLFGRLLAIYEKIENDVLNHQERDRETNAIRLQSSFVNFPMRTWQSLESSVVPYLQKLPYGLRIMYKNMIAEIVGMMEDDGNLNGRLSETYLLGYYLQRESLYSSKEKTNEE